MKLLNLEDSESDHQLLLHYLKKGGVRDVSARRITTQVELETALKDEKWNVVITDYDLASFCPLEALQLVRETSKYLPFIVVAGVVGEESVVEMMKAGVQDFVSKSRLERLGPVVKRSLRELAVHEQEARSRTIAKRAMAAKEEMLAIVYHDIKNPLAAIQLDAQLLDLLSQKDPGPEVMRDLRSQSQRILRTVDRLKVLVSDLLEQNNPYEESVGETFTIRKGHHNPLVIVNDVLDSLKPLIQEKNLTIKKCVFQKKASTYLDKERIHQVLSNILSNAMKFTPHEGEIVIELSEEESGETVFAIRDNGPGIHPEDLPSIFEKYWTGGTGNGLGLFICKSIVEAHGGFIEANSSEGRGATFSFKIPAVHEAEQKVSPEFSQRKDIIKTVYLVDDDHDLREVLSWALEKEGYRVLAFDSGELALNDLEHTFYPPDLIVLDFHMGEMKGNEFLTRKNHSCPVVMISAAPEDIKKSTDSSLYTDILVKPVDLNTLLKTVKRYI